ncbi:MAG: aldo/keto reductase [Lachnospiraceae bacterium]|nr:aldo/keto reductase [Lachnospiraceae bacterium]
MKYHDLGKSNIKVSKVSLGTWGLGGGSVWTDKDSTLEETKSLLAACKEQGINYIDTAPVYGTGVSEELLGKALKGCRNDFILQSKCSLNWRKEGGNFHYERDGYTVNNDTRGDAIKKDVEDSLLRMQVDHLDSVIVHYVCDDFPAEDTVDMLEKLIKEGKIRTYGISNSMPKHLEQYKDGALVQEFFSILSPFHGREYFDTCKKYGTTFQTYGVLEEGFLTGEKFLEKTFHKTDIRSRLPWVQEPCKEVLRKAFTLWQPLCEKYQCSYANLVSAWALSQYENMNLLVGMRKTANVIDSAKSVEICLTPDEVAMMEDSVKQIQVKVLDK